MKSGGIVFRPGSLPRLGWQVGLYEDSVSDSICLNKVNLRAYPFEEVLSSKLSTLPASSKWVFVAKWGEQVPMLESFLSSSTSFKVVQL